MSQLHTDLDNLDVIHNIFDQVSEDVLSDYKKSIDKLLKTPKEILNESTNCSSLITTFSSIKVLLKLYEKLYSSSLNNSSILSFKLILENIKYVLENNKENWSLSGNHLQQELLQIIQSLFKIAFVQKSEEDFCELAKFYHYNVNYINVNNTNGNLNKGELCLRLKILCTIFEVLSSLSERESNLKNVLSFNDVINDLKSIQGIDECKLFANIVIHNVDDAAILTLLFVIPQYVKCFKTNKVVNIIWEEVSSFMTKKNSSIKYSRILLIMCYLFDTCFIDSPSENKKDLMHLIFEDVNYWNLIQFGMIKNDPVMRKQAMYLFKKTIDLMDKSDESITSCDENQLGTCNINKAREIMWWDKNFKNELCSIFREIIVILEFLDEQQIHIIKPIYQMVEKLVEKMLKVFSNGKTIDFSWIILIYHRTLMHESAQVVKWGVLNLLNLPDNFFSDEIIVREIVCLLVPTLNNTSLYYNDGLTITKELTAFFSKITCLKIAKVFFNLFIKEVCQLVWSPEALFFVTHAIAQVPKNSFWEAEEIFVIRNFVGKAFKTHNKIIRSGVQCELLNSILKLSNVKSLSLESIVLLLSSFSTSESLQRGSQLWNKVIDWLRNSYSKNEAEKCVEKCSGQDSENEFNDRSLALMLILFFDAYEGEIKFLEYETTNCFVTNKVSKMLLSFKEINKRLYCDRSLHDHYLSIICQIVEENLNGQKQFEEASLLKILLPFAKDIISYIQMQVKNVSNLQDFYACQLYINTFENLLKMQELFNTDFGISINSVRTQILNDLEIYTNPNYNMSSVRIYCGMKLLKILIEMSSFENNEAKIKFLVSFLVKEVNEPLKKEESSSENTRDLNTLWGRMNSEFLEAKWLILETFISHGLLFHDSEEIKQADNWISNDILVKFCIEALNLGGYGVLCPVMSILKKILPHWNDELEAKQIIDSVWKLIMERRKSDEFKLFVKKFVEMLFQKELTEKGAVMQDPLLEYTNLLFLDSSLTVVNILMKHIQRLRITENGNSLFCYIVAKGMLFGPVQKKDERLTLQVCSHIESLNICSVKEICDYSTSNEIRGRAVQIISTLDKNRPTNQTFAMNMIDMLLKIENEVNKNKVRYFGDSHVHRVKHRVLQALLLLEPFLSENQDVAEKLLKWLYNSLMSESSQPSVKYQQEWLLIRILIKRSDFLNKFWDYFNDSVEKKTKGLCSLIAISHHLCKLVSPELTSSWINQAIPTLLPFCMDQHFEVRLYSQVVLEKLYEFAKNRNLHEITDKYEMINQCVLQSIQRGCKGNAAKNCIKLQEDFYLNVFNPLEHYSLQTIYMDLPRLANVGSDEWISTKMLKYCGVNPSQINILLHNNTNSLEELEGAKWIVERCNPSAIKEFNEDKSGEYLTENYQKKMIPLKPLIPGWEEAFYSDSITQSSNVKKDGLVVVASLIDRIPNLGGLARTCEIFGASEYIVGSLKYIEDKQFTSLSVTAEKWITIKEVKLQNLSDYVLEMKQIGYTVIGAEQALYSQSLSAVKFPKKSLLLLGNEKEGIPPNLLPLLDICVEIPQVGIIRSLNVHVTGALFIWEYAKQNHFS